VIRVLAVLLVLAVTITALVECVQTPAPRLLPRWLWFFVVLLLPLIGPAAWFLLGRVWGGRGMSPARRGPAAPDDDPSFLRQLDDEAWARRARERREDGGTPPSEPAA
jgi:hypothetical protein